MPTETIASLYETDAAAWYEAQAAALDQHDWSQLDWENLAEEIRGLGKSEKRAIWSYLNVLLVHLIKYELQPNRRSNSWRLSVRNARNKIGYELRDSPSLRPYLLSIYDEVLAGAYEDALAEMETTERPSYTRWTVEQALDLDFLPR